jgi:D-amino-acid oxidase
VTIQQPDVLVIGAGVSGLTTAICLAEVGRQVTVAAAERPPRSTSAAAGAIWAPHLVETGERVARWADVTMARLTDLAADPDTGVRLAGGVAASVSGSAESFDWVKALDSVAACDPADLPAGYAGGWRLTAPIISMSVYLGYLLARLERAGAALREAEFASLDEAAQVTGARVIVNCSGIGASRLVPDAAVTPVRGQVVVIGNPGLTEFFIGVGDDPAEFTYYFPHGDIVVLGGTEEAGNWSLTPDPAIAERILSRCAAAEPRLRGAAVAAHLVGLRPVRPSVRLEAESLDGRLVVHNYGHGGAGVTLSWGCAQDVTEAVLG